MSIVSNQAPILVHPTSWDVSIKCWFPAQVLQCRYHAIFAEVLARLSPTSILKYTAVIFIDFFWNHTHEIRVSCSEPNLYKNDLKNPWWLDTNIQSVFQSPLLIQSKYNAASLNSLLMFSARSWGQEKQIFHFLNNRWIKTFYHLVPYMDFTYTIILFYCVVNFNSDQAPW